MIPGKMNKLLEEEWDRQGKPKQKLWNWPGLWVLGLVSYWDLLRSHVERVWKVCMCLYCLPMGQGGTIYPPSSYAPRPRVTWSINPSTCPGWFPSSIPQQKAKATEQSCGEGPPIVVAAARLEWRVRQDSRGTWESYHLFTSIFYSIIFSTSLKRKKKYNPLHWYYSSLICYINWKTLFLITYPFTHVLEYVGKMHHIETRM